MTRRGFFKLSLFSALALGGALVCGRSLGVLGGNTTYPQRLLEGAPADTSRALAKVVLPSAGGARNLSPKQLVVLQAAALRILDGAEPAPAQDGAAAQLAFIDDYLGSLGAPLRRDFGALLELLEYYPLALHGARFTRLDAATQDRVLAGWQRSRWALLRQGFQGLKAMCCLAHYQDERSFRAIGYSGPTLG